MHSSLRLFNIRLALTVLACVAMVGTGCWNESTITGQLIFTDGSPMVNYSIRLCPQCEVPRMRFPTGGWTGGYDYPYLMLSSDGRCANPEDQTDEEGRFSLRVNKGWLKKACTKGPNWVDRRSEMKQANVECRTIGYTLMISTSGGYKTLEDLDTEFADSPWPYPYPIEDKLVDLGVLEVGLGWLLTDKYLPDIVDRTEIFATRQLFLNGCRSCHGPDALGGPDTTSSLARYQLTAGPDLTDDEWVHSDGTYEGIMNSLIQEVCKIRMKDSVEPVRFNVLEHAYLDHGAEYTRQEGREPWDRRGTTVRYPKLERMAAFVHALRYRPRSEATVQ